MTYFVIFIVPLSRNHSLQAFSSTAICTSYTGSASTTINFIEALNDAAIAICALVFFVAGSLGG